MLYTRWILASALVLAASGTAAAGGYGDRLVREGHEFFKSGNFFRAGEQYRCAILEEPAAGMNKLHYGHALFALGNYNHAAYSFRRGLHFLKYADDLRVDLIGFFPSRLSYDRSTRDVCRYASYFPNDPHAQTVIAYAGYFGGDWALSANACKKLLAIDPRDDYAAYILRRIEKDGGPGGGLAVRREREREPVLGAGMGSPSAPAAVIKPVASVSVTPVAPAPAVLAPKPPPAPLALPGPERSTPATTLSGGDVYEAISKE